MIRMLIYAALLLALAFGIYMLQETPGSVVLTYGGYEYRVTLAKAAGLLAGIIAVAMILWTLVRLLFRLPSLIALSNRMRRRNRGYGAISRGLVSVGVGDRRAAVRHAVEAERLLGREPMALLLKAQAAQLSGDRAAAEAAFRRMLETPETRVLGLRGLYVEARRSDGAAARRFVEEAYRLAPATPWAAEALLEYRSGDRDWRGARTVVDENASRRIIDRDLAKKQKAALLTAEALDLAEKSPDQAFASASEALKLNPGLVPAAVAVARRLIARGDLSKATRVLEGAWKLEPHPDLAEAYLGVRLGDSSHDKLKRARQLARLMPGAREAKLTLAQALIDAREFVEARQVLEALVLDQPTVRVCQLMAELEERDAGHAGMVRKWLSRAGHAPRDPAWVADGYVSDHWLPISPVTGRLDAFVWTTPPQSIEAKVRASIDADRHEPAAEPVSVEMQATPAAAPVAPAAAPVAPVETHAATPVALPAPAPAAAPPPDDGAPTSAEGPPHLPDDPGPRRPDAAPRKRWRLFG